jgi:hypothetical protein
MMHSRLALFGAFVFIAACSAHVRSPETYRNDTQRVLETRNARVKSCYDEALAADANVSGVVTVRFIVEKKTGTFTKATIDPTKSTATEPLVLCVLNAVNGLKLEPPDKNEGQATFVYELRPAPPAT